MAELQELLDTLPQAGRLVWIVLRGESALPPTVVEAAALRVAHGLVGDHARGGGKREVTLIQAEHLAAVGAFLGRDPIDPALLRRNLAVAGVNLLALRKRTFRVGEVLLEGTGTCDPCSRMEQALGPGGYNAMRGHGGINARVVRGGTVRLGDAVELVVAGP